MQYWYVDSNGNTAGPADEKALRDLRARGLIGDHTDVVALGQSNWVGLSTVIGEGSGGTRAGGPAKTTSPICPYCRTQEPPPLKVCPSCGTPHHHECWQELKGCTVYGCSEAPSDEPPLVITSESVRPRSSNPAHRNPVAMRPARRPMSRQNQSQQPKPPSGLVWAILSTFCCCMPAGVVAIVYASQVDSKYYAGDYVGALNSSRSAHTWSWVSFWVSVIFGFLYFLLIMASSM